MEILKNYDLKKHNTFGITAHAKFFAVVTSEQDLNELLKTPEFKDNNKLILGGGSNVLFSGDFDGMVILNALIGVEILEENEENVFIKAMGGGVWHDLVTFAVDRGYWGIENLSLIPGSVGAAPMQNIGAYGAELKNVLQSIEAVELSTGNKKVFDKAECDLGYRDSVFKQDLKNKYFITSITIKLSKKENKNLTYKILTDYLEKNKIDIKGPKDISDAVANIRRSKLPDPKVIGNAGSFFKNVFVDREKLAELQKNYPDIQYFEEENSVKIPAGWLVEACGWKGKRVGNTGVHDKQALVLVNHGGATGGEIKALAEEIIASVHNKFGLRLEPEVNLI